MATPVGRAPARGTITKAPAFYNDRQGEALAIDDIVTSMRRVIDQLTAAERKRILSSIRSKWSDIADRLEAPSSRNH
jgi:hypothetical protein